MLTQFITAEMHPNPILKYLEARGVKVCWGRMTFRVQMEGGCHDKNSPPLWNEATCRASGRGVLLNLISTLHYMPSKSIPNFSSESSRKHLENILFTVYTERQLTLKLFVDFDDTKVKKGAPLYSTSSSAARLVNCKIVGYLRVSWNTCIDTKEMDEWGDDIWQTGKASNSKF